MDTRELPTEIDTKGRNPKLPVELDPLTRAFQEEVRRQTRELGREALRIPVTADTARLRSEIGRDLLDIERRATLEVPVEPGDRAEFERQLRSDLDRVRQRVRARIDADVDVDEDSFRRSLRANADVSREGGGFLGRLFTSGFGGTLINPLIGIPAVVGAAFALPLAGALTAGAGLAGAALGSIFVGAFALRADQGLQNAASSFMDRLNNVFTRAAKPLRDPLISALDTIADAFERQEPNIRKIFDAVAPLIPVLAEGVAGFIEAFTPGLVEATKNAGPVIEQIAFALPDLGNALAQFLISLSSVDEEGADAIGKTLRGIADMIRTAGDAIAWLSRMFERWVAFIKGVGTAIGDVGRGLKAFWDALRGDTEDLFAALQEGFRRFLEWWSPIWRRIRDGATSAMGGVVSAARALPGQIVAAVGSLGTLLFQAGRNVVQGLIDGIRSRFPSLRSIASSMAATIRNFLPFSPAKEGPLSGRGAPFYSGQAIARDLAGGVESGLPAVESAANRLAGLFTPDTAMPAVAAASAGPDVLHLELDLGEGIRKVVEIKLRDRDRSLRRRAMAGAGVA